MGKNKGKKGAARVAAPVPVKTDLEKAREEAGKSKSKPKVVHAKGDKAPTLCGNWNPAASITDRPELVTCKTCLLALQPKEGKKSREAKPPVTITCTDCGAKREVPASQAHSVTRCEACQKAHLKAKRKAKAKARKARKHGDLRQAACDVLRVLTQQEGMSEDLLRTLATIIRETYPKAKKV